MNHTSLIARTTLALMLAAGSAQAQSLFRAPMPQQSAPSPIDQRSTPQAPAHATPNANEPANGSKPGDTKPAPQSAPAAPAPMAVASASAAPSMESVGLFVVQPTKPHTFQKHDKLDIIINEISNAKAEQSLDAKKSLDFNAELTQFPSMQALILASTLTNGIGDVKPSVGTKSNDQFKGNGTYERKDRFTARIAAIVQDVKPNGLIFVEARETIQTDLESKTMVLSGLCDPKDITNANTVQSSQLANLVIRVEHGGDVKDTATKSWITKFFENVFGP